MAHGQTFLISAGAWLMLFGLAFLRFARAALALIFLGLAVLVGGLARRIIRSRPAGGK